MLLLHYINSCINDFCMQNICSPPPYPLTMKPTKQSIQDPQRVQRAFRKLRETNRAQDLKRDINLVFFHFSNIILGN